MTVPSWGACFLGGRIEPPGQLTRFLAFILFSTFPFFYSDCSGALVLINLTHLTRYSSFEHDHGGGVFLLMFPSALLIEVFFEKACDNREIFMDMFADGVAASIFLYIFFGHYSDGKIKGLNEYFGRHMRNIIYPNVLDRRASLPVISGMQS
ncbi:hypothetical protein [Oceanimonas doudoroffii]|uniref:Uncharacterized protein n=1 Tax=Oceanimonas doudoroffii TaxID=84158 RepID=A0A233RGX0_9GAMM|nr:hypothetical protein [Oceanimonas doudoroffii]OXY82629.1 hypothetical protein B6S08_03675 [Oceanimonas doudoroffii]